MSTTTIVLADDHQIVREGLRALLEAEADFSVVGEAADGRDAVERVERLKPSVLILDLVMPSLSGLEVTRQIRQRVPQTRIIVLSMHDNEAYVLEALRNGASGYVLKDTSAATLVQAVRAVAAGGRYLCGLLSERAIEAYLQKSTDAPVDAYETLTTREREVFQLAAEGHGNTDIAARLSISPRTVEIHRTNLKRKLALHSQVDLVRYALRRGILPLD